MLCKPGIEYPGTFYHAIIRINHREIRSTGC